jgi:hypothetical protein
MIKIYGAQRILLTVKFESPKTETFEQMYGKMARFAKHVVVGTSTLTVNKILCIQWILIIFVFHFFVIYFFFRRGG